MSVMRKWGLITRKDGNIISCTHDYRTLYHSLFSVRKETRPPPMGWMPDGRRITPHL